MCVCVCGGACVWSRDVLVCYKVCVCVHVCVSVS